MQLFVVLFGYYHLGNYINFVCMPREHVCARGRAGVCVRVCAFARIYSHERGYICGIFGGIFVVYLWYIWGYICGMFVICLWYICGIFVVYKFVVYLLYFGI